MLLAQRWTLFKKEKKIILLVKKNITGQKNPFAKAVTNESDLKSCYQAPQDPTKSPNCRSSWQKCANYCSSDILKPEPVNISEDCPSSKDNTSSSTSSPSSPSLSPSSLSPSPLPPSPSPPSRSPSLPIQPKHPTRIDHARSLPEPLRRRSNSTDSVLDIESQPYFFNCPRQVAEEKLKGQKHYTYLLRLSSLCGPKLFVISFFDGSKFKHVQFSRTEHGLQFVDGTEFYHNVNLLSKKLHVELQPIQPST